ncbi:MAG TPA: thioredoxin family protein [Verrucomicrobiae bacterium]|nr:thioredoxin family protein [Verrucomicrobiae bacterium]
MKASAKALIIGVVVALAAAAFVAKRANRGTPVKGAAAPVATANAPAERPLPRLVDLGAGKCIPCKKMAPILEQLKKEYAGRLVVEFIDVWENPGASDKYNINLIPTQIFYDVTGKELWRHEGFFGREEILAKWKELGVDLGGTP